MLSIVIGECYRAAFKAAVAVIERLVSFNWGDCTRYLVAWYRVLFTHQPIKKKYPLYLALYFFILLFGSCIFNVRRIVTTIFKVVSLPLRLVIIYWRLGSILSGLIIRLVCMTFPDCRIRLTSTRL